MIIAGGAYNEECQFPPESNFFGSGVRAAAAIKNIVPTQNRLHTCVGQSEEGTLRTYADTFGFDIDLVEIPETVTFDYLHNHSNPRLSPRAATEYNTRLEGIEGDAILRFGLIEGTAVVHGGRVVYDPQSTDPEPFQENGSTADELALVLNHEEAAALANRNEIGSIFAELRAGDTNADVVVIKRGAKGAIVKTEEEISRVPVFQTKSVWGIGSGDIFSAVFAAEWAEHGQPAPDAAEAASKATAYYCQHRQLPIPRDLDNTSVESAPRNFTPPNAPAPTIYLAGPFFDIGEVFVVEEVAHLLESEGADVLSPLHDIGRAAEYDTAEEVAEKDLEAIEEADLVFALLDQLDGGTHFEIGYAQKAGTPVVAYANDAKSRNYTMIQGSGCRVFGDLASAVYNAIWRAYA